MKKLIALLTLIIMVGVTVIGCGPNDAKTTSDNNVGGNDDIEKIVEEGEVEGENGQIDEEWDNSETYNDSDIQEDTEVIGDLDGAGGLPFEPFSYSPESDIWIDYMEDIICNEAKYEEMYRHYKLLRVGGLLSEDLDSFIDKVEEEHGEERLEEFADNGEKYILVQLVLLKDPQIQDELDEEAKKIVDSYLKYTRLGEGEMDFYISQQLDEHDAVGRVKRYMEENGIVVEEIIFPETFEDTNYDIFPIKYTYRYVLRGTANNEPFEKEVIQDFYIGWDWTEGEENMYDVIEYITDANE